MAASAAALVVLLPVVLGIAQTTIDLISSATPLPGFTGGQINADALQLLHGQGLYHDPATGYIGSVYAPGVAIAASLLDRLGTWTGWVPLICYLSAVPLAATVGWLSHGGGGEGESKWLALTQSAGLAALAWWLLSILRSHSLYDGHVDHAAWALMFLGLILVPGAAEGKRSRLVGATALFSLALWTKQITAVGPIAAFLWLSLPGRPAGSRRRAVWLVATLLVVNGIVLAVLSVLTHGWAFRWLLLFGTTQPPAYGLRHIALEFLQDHALLLIALSAVSLAALAAVRAPQRVIAEREHADVRGQLSLLLAFLLVCVPFVVAARRVQGGEDNDYIPITWGLLLVLGVSYRVARRRALGQLTFAVTAAVLALAATALGTSLDRIGIARAGLHQHVRWATQPDATQKFEDQQRSIYDSTGTVWSHDERGQGFPSYLSVLGASSSGHPPTYLVRALLDRQFAAVVPFSEFTDAGSAFASAHGRYEENFIWKLNRVIFARYAAPGGMQGGVLVRRSGPVQSAWMDKCFGPFTVGALRLIIRHGGGFWCQPSGRGDVLTLRQTPAPWSQVETQVPFGSVSGSASLSITRGWAHLALLSGRGQPIEIYLARSSGSPGWMVTVQRGGAVVLRQRRTRGIPEIRIPFQPVSVAASGGTRPVDSFFAAGAGNRMRLEASAASDARLDLSGLHSS